MHSEYFIFRVFIQSMQLLQLLLLFGIIVVSLFLRNIVQPDNF